MMISPVKEIKRLTSTPANNTVSEDQLSFDAVALLNSPTKQLAIMDNLSNHSHTSRTGSLSSLSPTGSPARRRRNRGEDVVEEGKAATPSSKQLQFQRQQQQQQQQRQQDNKKKLPESPSKSPLRMRRAVSAPEHDRPRNAANNILYQQYKGASFIRHYRIHHYANQKDDYYSQNVDEKEDAVHSSHVPLNRLVRHAGEHRPRHLELLAKHSRQNDHLGSDPSSNNILEGLQGLLAWATGGNAETVGMADGSTQSLPAETLPADRAQTPPSRTAAFLEECSLQEHQERRNRHRRIEAHPLGDLAQTLTYTQHDVLRICVGTESPTTNQHRSSRGGKRGGKKKPSNTRSDDAFAQLQASLRNKGVVTNQYLKENLHFYVQHIQ